MIKISLREITSKGIDIDQTIPMDGIGLSEEELDIRSPLHVKVHLQRVDDFVIADTEVEADFGFTCARCLESFHVVKSYPYTFDFEIATCGEYIDLSEEIRQEMIMANPPRILCKKDCKGICSGCGMNLNVEKCSCKK